MISAFYCGVGVESEAHHRFIHGMFKLYILPGYPPYQKCMGILWWQPPEYHPWASYKNHVQCEIYNKTELIS